KQRMSLFVPSTVPTSAATPSTLPRTPDARSLLTASFTRRSVRPFTTTDASYRTLYLTKQLEHLPVECRDIVGLATGHELAIDNYFLIHPLRPGILRV